VLVSSDVIALLSFMGILIISCKTRIWDRSAIKDTGNENRSDIEN